MPLFSSRIIAEKPASRTKTGFYAVAALGFALLSIAPAFAVPASQYTTSTQEVLATLPGFRGTPAPRPGDSRSTGSTGIAAPTPVSFPHEDQLVVFAGDLPSRQSVGAPLTRMSISTTASLYLQRPVVDLTVSGQTIAGVEAQIARIVALKPRFVVLFIGLGDQQAKTPDEVQTAKIEFVSKAIAAQSGAPVYVLASSTELNAATSANVRIGASTGARGVAYIELGSEVKGSPFGEALEQMKKRMENNETVPPAPVATAIARMSHAPATTRTTNPVPDAVRAEAARANAAVYPTAPHDPDAPVLVTPTPATLMLQPPKPLREFRARRPASASKKKEPGISR